MTPAEPDPDVDEVRSATGKAIRLRRVELDLSRADLARDSGVSYTYVSEIENGTKQASSKTLWRIARALGLEPHELMALAAQWETRPPARAPNLPAARSRSLGAPDAPTARWFHAAPRSTSDLAAAEIVDVLDRIATALEGVPDERAELALLLSLDERRTRRVVREELDRRGLGG